MTLLAYAMHHPVALSRREASDTSKAAADGLNRTNGVGAQAGRVYDAILRRGRDGATIDEIDVALAVDHQSMSPRFSGLEDAGLIVRTKARRPSRSGHACIVWVAREYAPVYDDRPVLTLS